MSLPTTSTMRLARAALRAPSSAASSATTAIAGSSRCFSACTVAAKEARRGREGADDPMELDKTPKFNYDDVPTLGHQILQRRRQMLKYLRTIEFEMPKLEALRQPYKPPTPSQLLRFRFQHYQGEAHPASRKVVLYVSVQALFASGHLKTEAAKHKFLVLAGQRLHRSRPVSLAGPDGTERLEDIEGEIVISCERMPNERQNMKWCSDTFDKLLAEANAPQPDLSSIPIDPRPDLVREAKKRTYARKDKPKLRDFPQHWLGGGSGAAGAAKPSSSQS